MDFTKLRATALKDGDDEEAVTVNTRALIDKVLARYSGEWTTLRELIQNAADAQATTVTIKFETLPSASVPLSNTTSQSEVLKHVLLHHTLRRLLVTNNGQPFGVNDWSRLKRIAEGNPDETKIGAFGVGFYSVFADCEEPFVSSGNEAMAFYWKANSLFTKRLQIPPAESNPNTSFVLDYRNSTTPMPNLLSICQFLATSLTFVALQKLELQVDDWTIIKLEKKAAPSIDVPIARDVETKTKEGLMRVQSMERESVQMDATFMNVVGWKPSISASISKPGYESSYGSSSDVPSIRSFFSRLTASTSHAQLKTKAMKEEKALQNIVLEDLTAITTANVFLRVTTAIVKTSVSGNFAVELERATKKPPPKTTKLAILTSSYDETAASSKENLVAKGVDVFSSVLPGKKPGGRIFIGFPTHQTTGAGMHLSAPSVIPTVERESIDLNARWVRTWNQEMLRVAGIMARLAFTNEMADLSSKIKRATELAGHGTKVSKDEIAQFMPEALHTLKSFTFGESTPSSQVSQIIEEAFWTAYKKPSIEIYSSRGVLPTTRVRLATEDLSGFVEGIPVVPEAVADGNFVTKLKDFGLITEITFSDVKQELEAKALTKEQLVSFISWAGKKAITGDMDRFTIQNLMETAVAMTGEAEGSGDVIALGTITNYLSASKIPAEFPIPPTTIPFQFTRTLSINELQALGWEPLEIVPWLRFLIETNSHRSAKQSLTTNTLFAASVLQVLSKAWDGLSPGSKTTVTTLLQPLTIIPTKAGMKKPGESFFASVKLFDDLPTVTSCPGVKEKFFAAIGVRKTVDLETIFARLLAPTPAARPGETAMNYRHMDVVKYLASVKEDIPKEDIQRLKNSQICPAEAGPKGMEPTVGSTKLYRVSELFEPKDSLRELRLPIIQWPGPPGSFRPASVEGRFLASLGLRTQPSVSELIDLMASGDPEMRSKSMSYFVSNHHLNNYGQFDLHQSNKAFLPLQGETGRLVSPSQCFTNERCSILGFSILSRGLIPHANKFGVAMDPPMSECIQKLIAKPPRTRSEAISLFGYFTSRIGEISQQGVKLIASSRIVPIVVQKDPNGSSEKLTSTQLDMKTPAQCYLGSSSIYSEIFDFVDFGSEGNAFLLKCGAKNEPTVIELANLACQEPARLLGVLQNTEKYLDLLRKLADELHQLKRDKVLFTQMKTAKFLVGYVEISASKGDRKSKQLQTLMDDDPEAEDLEDAPIKQTKLVSANNIVVNDEYVGYRLFKDSLICAPEEEKLESFYVALGAQTLRSLIQEDLRLGELAPKQDSGTKLRSHVIERAKLFLHEATGERVKHDGRWLEKNLSVQIVTSISLRRTLRSHTLAHTEKISAAVEHDRKTGWTLFVTAGSYDTYQISQALCKVLLDRPSQGASLTFEQFLNLSLYQLRARGYNVERILRAKAAEQRMAEEDRKKQMAMEQQQIKEQEEQWKQQNQSHVIPAAAGREERVPDMPGAFGSDSPENSPQVKKNRGSSSIFSSISKKLGINNSSSGSGSGSEVQEQLQNFLGGGSVHDTVDKSPPPPYDEGKQVTEKVSNPADVQQNLHNAIQSSRAYNSSSLFSPPTTQNIKEQATYCDSTPSQNISLLADASNGMRIFISNNMTTDPTTFLSENVSALNTFSLILQDVCDVYALPRTAMHIFYDATGGTIAFNSGGAIFCNFRFFSQLHEKKMGGSRGGEAKTEAGVYWWVVVAHELAHNLVKEHDARHSFYTEMLVANNFPKMMARTATYLNPVLTQQPGITDGKKL